jgi:hypothetical protein
LNCGQSLLVAQPQKPPFVVAWQTLPLALPLQSTQALPPAPHLRLEVPARQVVPSQQPFGQLVESQTQLPPTQRWPLPQLVQVPPPVPQLLSFGLCWQVPFARQQPVQPVAALQVQAPLLQVEPLPQFRQTAPPVPQLPSTLPPLQVEVPVSQQPPLHCPAPVQALVQTPPLQALGLRQSADVAQPQTPLPRQTGPFELAAQSAAILQPHEPLIQAAPFGLLAQLTQLPPLLPQLLALGLCWQEPLARTQPVQTQVPDWQVKLLMQAVQVAPLVPQLVSLGFC